MRSGRELFVAHDAGTKAQIKLLGGFELIRPSGAAVKISGRKSQGLLAVLALSPGLSCSRDRLAGLLWSDRSQNHSRNSLRQALTALRKELGDAGLEILATEGDQVRMLADQVEIDAVDFSRCAQQGKSMDAATLYEGPLLDGIFLRDDAFEVWASGERQRLADLAFSVQERVYESELGPARLAAARRLLALDPLHERAHRAVMEALALAGERNQALRQYDACREMLAHELGTEPSRETERLKAAIMSDEVNLAASSGPTIGEVEEIEVRDEPVIAVLPFVSLSDDAEREFFAEGVSDLIATTLAKLPYVRVIAHSSTQSYKDRAVDVREVGREQGAGFVLEGTVQSAGDRLRLSVQLSDCASGHQLWSEKFDRTVDDIFALQDEITFSVVVALDVELREGKQAHFRVGESNNLEAWVLVLQATKLLNAHERNSWPGAKRVIEKAVKLDPDYAMAWTLLGWWHWEEAFCGWSHDPEESIAASIAAAQRACELSPTNPEPHLVLAMAHLQRRDFDKAAAHMEMARKLGPNHAMVPAIGANVSMFCDEPEEALRQSRQAIRYAPVYPPWYAGDAAQICLQLNRLEEAIEWARAAIKRDEGYIHAHLFLVVAYHELGKTAESRAAAKGALRVDPAFSAQAWADAQPFKDQKNNERFLTALIAAGLPA
jgi:TolB-like protein